MPEFFQDWTPQAYGIWTGVFAFFGWMGKQWLETRKLSSSDRQANREGFVAQVASYQVENRKLRDELGAMRITLQDRDRDHDEYRQMCRAETDQLRGELRAISNEFEGIKRKYEQLQISVGRQLAEARRDDG